METQANNLFTHEWRNGEDEGQLILAAVEPTVTLTDINYLTNEMAISESTMSSDTETPCEPTEPHCFEGPEKNLEVIFKPGIGPEEGCRSLPRDALDQICAEAKCTILSKISNAHMDAYVLSESSLFVYRLKMVLKTCGTTTLLRCLRCLLKLTAEIGMELEWVGYSRKNFSFPGVQIWPHCSFNEEMAYLKSHSHLSERLHGSGYILGPVTGDHWFVYVADQCTRPNIDSTDRTINLMMFDMHPDVAKMFFKDSAASGREMTQKTGIAHLVPGATVDEFSFAPCGYSMNAILHGSYTTVHVTPEQICSYASFETNTPLRTYTSTIRNALNVFRPRRFVLTMFADEAGLKLLDENPFDITRLHVPQVGMFARSNVSSTKVETDTCCFMANYTLVEAHSPSRANSSPRSEGYGSADERRRRGMSLI